MKGAPQRCRDGSRLPPDVDGLASHVLDERDHPRIAKEAPASLRGEPVASLGPAF
jgi:hypothetical protein